MIMYLYDVPALATFRVYARSEEEAVKALAEYAEDTEIEFILNERSPRVEFVNVTTKATEAELICKF